MLRIDEMACCWANPMNMVCHLLNNTVFHSLTFSHRKVTVNIVIIYVLKMMIILMYLLSGMSAVTLVVLFLSHAQ